MGQYYLLVNLDKKEYLETHKFNDCSKLMEFGQSAGGVLLGLTILLADGNGRGGGDINSDDSIIGSWAGDRIVITGDYANPRKFLTEQEIKDYQEKYKEEEEKDRQQYMENNTNLYSIAQAFYEDISNKIVKVLIDAKEFPQDRIDGIKQMNEWMNRKNPEFIK